MSLIIKLEKPGPYRPGSTVTGHVEFTSSSDEEIAYIDINFSGRCKVKIRKHDHYTTLSYRSRGYYFSKHLSLYSEGKFKHKAGTYSWPFSFQIPEYASRKKVTGAPTAPRAQTTWRPARQQIATGSLQPGVGHELENDTFPYMPPFRTSALNAIHPHDLPASFSHAYSGFPAAFEGRVEYILVATLTRPTGSLLFAPKNLEASLDVNVKPFRPYSTRNIALAVQKHESLHTISTLRLIPSKAERRLTWREKTRSVLSSSSVPSCTFKIAITSPQYLTASADSANTLPMTMTVLRIRNNQNSRAENIAEDLPTPSLKITSFSIWVRARTMMRDNGKAALDQKIDHEEKTFIVPRTEVDLDVPVSSESPTTDSTSLPLTPPHTPPSRTSTQLRYTNTAASSSSPTSSCSIDLGQHLKIRLLPDILPPTFSTYNIYRSYTLGYKFRIESLGEAIDVNRDGIEVRVVPEIDPTGPPAPRSRRSFTSSASASLHNVAIDGNGSSEKGGGGPSTRSAAMRSSRRRDPVAVPADPEFGEDLPQYQHDAPEGPLPAFQ